MRKFAWQERAYTCANYHLAYNDIEKLLPTSIEQMAKHFKKHFCPLDFAGKIIKSKLNININSSYLYIVQYTHTHTQSTHTHKAYTHTQSTHTHTYTHYIT